MWGRGQETQAERDRKIRMRWVLELTQQEAAMQMEESVRRQGN